VNALLAVPGAIAAAYQLLSTLAALRFPRRPQRLARLFPPVSILKPVHGVDPHFYEAIRSHAVQDYPEYEVLFGVSDPEDPAIPPIRQLMREFPGLPVRLVVASTRAPNQKVGVLIELARHARHPILVINDSDIEVPSDYLRRLVGPLEDPEVGLVTCLYRGQAESWAARFEALAIATEFAPGVLVAPWLGVREFALGATMALRAADLERIGGFEAVADYLADDYQLGRRIDSAGLRVVLAPVVVTTYLPNKGWREAWRHQVRWARTLRVCRGGGYLGMPVTMATLWAVLLALRGSPLWGAALLAVRMLSALAASRAIGMQLRPADVPAIPARDLWGVAVWAAGLAGSRVVWRGRHLQINREGKIVGGVRERVESPAQRPV
jgi:ceramide glucosyltransferase